jgi:hypothetical protein
MGQAEQVLQEGALVEMDAQQLGQLVDHDHEADPGLEAGQDRLGDQVGDGAEPQQGGREVPSSA